MRSAQSQEEEVTAVLFCTSDAQRGYTADVFVSEKPADCHSLFLILTFIKTREKLAYK